MIKAAYYRGRCLSLSFFYPISAEDKSRSDMFTTFLELGYVYYPTLSVAFETRLTTLLHTRQILKLALV